MKKLFSVDDASKNIDLALVVARISIAVLMLSHGLPKLIMLLSGAPVQFPPVFGMSPEFSLVLTVFAEVLCALFILVGFGTRLAAIPLIITMLVAVLVIHAADPLSVKEPALLYLFGFTMLAIAGSGKYSIDYLLQRTAALKQSNQPEDPTLAIYQ